MSSNAKPQQWHVLSCWLYADQQSGNSSDEHWASNGGRPLGAGFRDTTASTKCSRNGGRTHRKASDTTWRGHVANVDIVTYALLIVYNICYTLGLLNYLDLGFNSCRNTWVGLLLGSNSLRPCRLFLSSMSMHGKRASPSIPEVYLHFPWFMVASYPSKQAMDPRASEHNILLCETEMQLVQEQRQ